MENAESLAKLDAECILGTENTRRFMFNLIALTGAFGEISTTEELAGKTLGRVQLGQELKTILRSHAPDNYKRMLRENVDDL